MRTALSILLTLTLLPAALDAQKKKKKPKIEITQTLEVLPDPPASVTVETAKLEFLASPLSGKGLLSQQIRDALKSLRAQAGSRPIVKIRAFVSGTGDQRRVPSIVSETFAERKQPLPAVSTIQVGQLGLEGAQVVLEAVVTNRKSVNPHGLAFLSGMGGVGTDPPEKLSTMLDKAIDDLTRAARAAGSEPADVTRVTCLLSSTAPISEVRSRIAAAFPSAVLTAVQAERLGVEPEGLLAHNPRLVVCTISAYGRHAGHAGRPGYDALVAARLGLLHEQRGHMGGPIPSMAGEPPFLEDLEIPERMPPGSPRQGPIFTYTPWPSMSAAFQAVLGISAALYAREHTGQGQHVETSLLLLPNLHQLEIVTLVQLL